MESKTYRYEWLATSRDFPLSENVTHVTIFGLFLVLIALGFVTLWPALLGPFLFQRLLDSFVPVLVNLDAVWF